jgi:asparagine synthase (glutamine-hydrolysing)
MSGIAGLFFRDGRPAAGSVLDRMAGALRHRGPHGLERWSRGPVGLAHLALRMTPESLVERVPLADPTGALVITADARIDNRDQLLGELRPPERTGVGDAALILEAYARWGPACPGKLLGDFAFAIWDGRNRTLFCARDHFGVKPLYYSLSHRLLAFASEIKALLQVPEVGTALDDERVADHLAAIFEDRASTFFQHVRRLPPGHRLTVGPDGHRLESYWTLARPADGARRSDAECVEGFSSVFSEAVGCRLRSVTDPGCLLSGGLDSSSVAAVARRRTRERRDRGLHTFSAVFPGVPEPERRKIDERAFVSAVVAMGGVEAHYVRADRLSPFTDVERVLWHEDEAVLAPNLYMHWGLYREAHRQAVGVLLDGIDGDTTVSHGLSYLSELARGGRVGKVVREARALARRHGRSTRAVLGEFAIRPLLPPWLRGGWGAAAGGPVGRSALLRIVKPAFARRVGLDERLRQWQAAQRRVARTANEEHWRALVSPMFPYTFELADKAAAAFSIEPRYPFFDRRLVEYCLALPPDQKLRDGWTRLVLRRAMAGVLPDEVCWRTSKADLGVNFRRQMLEQDGAVLEDVIVRAPGALESYVEVEALRQAYRRYAAQPMAGDPDALVVYGAVTLGLWLRARDGRSTGPRPIGSSLAEMPGAQYALQN